MRVFLKDIGAISAFFFFFIVFGGAILNYISSGSFTFNYALVQRILGENIHYIFLILLALILGIFGTIVYYRYQLEKRKNCEIHYVELEQIATLWLSQVDFVENVKNQIIEDNSKTGDEQEKVHLKAPQDVQALLLDITSQDARDFAKKEILPNLNRLDEYEIRIVFELLAFLDKNKNITSVATLFNEDPEKMTYSSKVVTSDGKTSYDILKTFTLLNHTIRVSDNILTMIKDGGRETGGILLYARALITALAHDIGKVEVHGFDTKIKGQMYRTVPHEKLSAIIFQEMYPDYNHVQAVIDAIKSHHISKPQGTISYYLKLADQKSREQEISLWLTANKKDENLMRGVEPQMDIVEKNDFIDQILVVPAQISETKDKEEIPIPAQALNQEIVVKQKVKRLKIIEDTGAESKEFSYDFSEVHGDAFVAALLKNVNKVEVSTFTSEDKIVSVSFGDVVLYDYLFFKTLLEKLAKKRLDKKNLVAIYTQLMNNNFIKMVNIEEEYFVSTFFINDQKSSPKKVSFVPISCEAIGLNNEEIEESKRSNPKLRNIEITSFSKKEG